MPDVGAPRRCPKTTRQDPRREPSVIVPRHLSDYFVLPFLSFSRSNCSSPSLSSSFSLYLYIYLSFFLRSGLIGEEMLPLEEH